MRQTLALAATVVGTSLATLKPAHATAVSSAMMEGTQAVANLLTTVPSHLGWKVFVVAGLLVLALDRLRARKSNRFEY